MLIWPIWSLDSKIELNNGINLFFACWYNFMKINLKVIGVGTFDFLNDDTDSQKSKADHFLGWA